MTEARRVRATNPTRLSEDTIRMRAAWQQQRDRYFSGDETPHERRAAEAWFKSGWLSARENDDT